jgi:hypothetical protein
MKVNKNMVFTNLKPSVIGPLVAKRFNAAKTTGGKDVPTEDFVAFFKTLQDASCVDRKSTALVIDGEQYQLADYKLDDRLSGLVTPREVNIVSFGFPDVKDLSECPAEEDSLAMLPGEFALFQETCFAKFRNSAHLSKTMTELTSRKVIENVRVFADGTSSNGRLHVETPVIGIEFPVILTASFNSMVEVDDFFNISYRKWLDSWLRAMIDAFRTTMG